MTDYAPMIDSGPPVLHYENPNEELTGHSRVIFYNHY